MPQEPTSITALYNLVMYGLCVAVIGLSGFIYYLIKRHDKILEKITTKMDERQKETNEVISKHSNILELVKNLLENKR